MTIFPALMRELRFTLQDGAIKFWMLVLVVLSLVSIGFGLAEVERQKATIQKLTIAQQQDRQGDAAKMTSWGAAAYYGFHLTHHAPSHFAFAALGQRDQQPWKHRIRMLALEGQIYERDVGNPSVALIGRFDFAFFVAFIFPLILILLLYDVRSSELTAGRYNLLEATAFNAKALWIMRVAILVGLAFLAVIAPLILAGSLFGGGLTVLALACLGILLFTIFWGGLCYYFTACKKSGPVTLIALIAVWLLTAVVIPAGARLGINHFVPLPAGADILLLQRETVNDAWDLPRETTMQAFFEHHPQWSGYTPETSAFEWQWYYAFQQMGDQKAQHLARAHYEGRLKRDKIAGWVAYILPSSLLERTLQGLAKTDVRASLHYEASIRAYHAELRAFYYPKFFRNEPFDASHLEDLPRFKLQ